MVRVGRRRHHRARRPRVVWIASLLILVAGALGLTQLQASGVPQSALILSASNAVDGQDALGRHFDAGSGSPVYVVAPAADGVEVRVEATDAVLAAARAKVEAEQKTLQDIAAGRLDASWIRATLTRIGCRVDPA